VRLRVEKLESTGMTRMGKTVRLAGYGIAAAVVMFVIGFVGFVVAIPTENSDLEARADGIVVLTGGASRIADALLLLDAGHARRMLITGVHPSTTRAALTRRTPQFDHLFDCCIDIGHSAVNTAGNAGEARSWAQKSSFTSLIVVTSNYHLRRSIAEFSRAMPDIRLVPYPVVAEGFRRGSWWIEGEALRIVFTEYVKYLAARTRQVLFDPRYDREAPSPIPVPGPVPPAPEPAQ